MRRIALLRQAPLRYVIGLERHYLSFDGPPALQSLLPIKILLAEAWRTPIVAIINRAEGLPVIHNNRILIADDAEGFAESTVKFLKHLEKGAADCLLLL